MAIESIASNFAAGASAASSLAGAVGKEDSGGGDLVAIGSGLTQAGGALTAVNPIVGAITAAVGAVLGAVGKASG